MAKRKKPAELPACGWQEDALHINEFMYYAPEGCQHGTHPSGTAYTRGTYSRVHTIGYTSRRSYAA